MMGGDVMADLNWLTSPTGAEFLHRLACKGPADCNTIARECGTHRNNVRKIMHQAHAAGVVHVARFERVRPLDRAASKVWALGPGVDAARVVYGRVTRHVGRWETSDSSARILARLTCSDCTIKVLSSECHLTETATRGQVRQLLAAGVIHLRGFAPTDGVGGMPGEVLRLGPGRAATLKRKSKSETYRAWRQRKIEKFGYEVAQRMFRARSAGGADVIVLDGRVVYRRAEKAFGTRP